MEDQHIDGWTDGQMDEKNKREARVLLKRGDLEMSFNDLLTLFRFFSWRAIENDAVTEWM